MSPANQFFGKYRGTVTNNIDPLMIGRIQASVPDVLGSQDSGWALPCAPFGGSQTGFFAVPIVGAGVWIEFEHGDPDYPIWSGCFWGSSSDRPSTLLVPLYKVMIITQGGHSILLDDTPGTGGITLQTSTGQKIVMDATGIQIDNGLGATIKMQGPQISVNNDALTVT